MGDAIAVFNAGSSSLKFSLFALERRRACAGAARPDRRALDAARVSSRTTPSACVVATRTWPTPTLDHAARLDQRARTAARRARRRPPRARSAIAWFTAAPRYARRCASMRRAWRAGALVPLAPLHQPHNLAPIRAAARRSARSCRRWRASTPRSTARSPSWRRRSRCRGDHDARRAALRLSRAVVRVHRHACCRAVDRAAAAGRTVRARTSATAPVMCALQRRPQRRHDDGLHRARRPADGHALRRARPRACCCYLIDEHGMDARAHRAAAVPRVRAARRLGRVQRHAHAAGRAPTPRSRLAIELFVYRIVRETRIARRGARRPRCARVHRRHRRARRRRCARWSAPTPRGSASSSTRRRTHARPVHRPRAAARRVGHPDRRGR